uniref:Rab GTPase domain-containing protein n=1 Tax=Meloidogyne hapla TaxID=6305 RepID=A0A1I8BCY2_MELHA
VTKGDENNDTCNTSNSHLTNSSNDIQNNNDNPLINVSLKELFENKLLNTKRTEVFY